MCVHVYLSTPRNKTTPIFTGANTPTALQLKGLNSSTRLKLERWMKKIPTAEMEFYTILHSFIHSSYYLGTTKATFENEGIKGTKPEHI